MNDNFGEFPLLMDRVRGGNQEAAKALLEQYDPQIRFAVRCRLNPKMRSLFDSIDFTQDVWKSFFANLPNPTRVGNADDLLRYLEAIAKHKVVDATRQRLTSQKYDVNRQFSLEDSSWGGSNDALIAPQDTPSAIVSQREQLDRKLRKLPIVYRRIVILLHEGQKPADIAAELGLRLRSVYRIIRKLSSEVES